jgi:cyclophilin family peptidyl-prolyl cis-trans isomerase
MRWRSTSFWELFRKPAPARRRPRLCVEQLECRCTPANASGVITGTALIQNAFGTTDIVGMNVTLTGTTNQNSPVTALAMTDSQGHFSFTNVLPGTYQLSAGTNAGFLGNPTFSNVSASPGVDIVPSLPIGGGQSVNVNVTFLGLDPHHIFGDQFTASTTASDFAYSESPGSGSGLANYRPNNIPIVKHPIGNFTVPQGSAPTFIDLAAYFSDPDVDATAPTQVTFNTSGGPINVNLFDTTAPQVVTNFLDYVNAGTYANAVFTREALNGTNGPDEALQGGSAILNTNGSPLSLSPTPQLNPVPIENEFSHSNSAFTLATALGGNINTDTNDFFFNLGDNGAGFDASGHYTVFGEAADGLSQALITALGNTPHTDVSSGPVATQLPNATLNTFPLNNYPHATGANFPNDATVGNFLLINSITLGHQDENLTYSVVGDTKSSLVTATLTNEFLKLNYVAGQTGSATITVRATDRYGATVDQSFTVTVAPPGASNVVLSWTGPNQLTATVTNSDPNNVTPSLTYSQAYVNVPGGVPATNGPTSSLTSSFSPVSTLGLALGLQQFVTVSVTPGNTPGAPATPMTVQAGPAIVSGVTITADSSTAATTLTANATGTDQEGHALTSPADFTYKWFQGTNLIAGQTGQSLPVSALSSPTNGTQVSVQVTPVDVDGDGLSGLAFTTKPVTFSGATSIQAPVVTAVTITPDSLTNTTTLTANPTSAGPDNYTYQWSQNSTAINNSTGKQQTLNLTTAMLNTLLAAGDKFTVTVTPNEGTPVQGTAFTTGPVTIASVTPTTGTPTSVTLTAPVISSVGINATGNSPAVFTTTSTLTATVLFQDPNQHAVSFQWFQNGTPLAGQNASTLNLASLSGVQVGDNFAVQVAPVGGQSVTFSVPIAS